MKTLKTMLLGLTLLVASTVANAKTTQTSALTKNDVLNIYVNAVVHGKVEGVENVLAKDVKYTLNRGEKQFIFDKKQLLESLKTAENIEQSCEYTTSIMDENDKGMVVKLTMRYNGYTRNTLITIGLNHADFQITKITAES